MNPYAYVGGNPVTNVDPSGLFNPVKGLAALGNGINAGRLYVSGMVKLTAAAGLSGTGLGSPAGILAGALGTWNVNSAVTSQDRSLLLWNEARNESWNDASWKNLLGVLPYGEQYDDLCESSFSKFWEGKLESWGAGRPIKFISEIGTMGL